MGKCSTKKYRPRSTYFYKYKSMNARVVPYTKNNKFEKILTDSAHFE